MLVRLALAAALLLAVIFLLRWFLRAPPTTVARVLRRSALYTGAGVLIFLAATGRLHWLFAAIGALFALIPRLISLVQYVPILGGIYRRYKAAHSTVQGPAPGKVSQVEARFVRMSLNHDSGAIDGMVLEGRFKGSRLTELSIDALIELLRDCRVQDEESAQLVQAFLDNVHGDTWRARAREQPSGAGPAPSGLMNRDEAYEILGLKPGASTDDIVTAHRRLMQKVHPDRGGSDYLAAKINQAKDVLMAKS